MTFSRFLGDDSGAVTVDWVVLTAVSVGFGLMVLATLTRGTLDVASEVETALAEADVAMHSDDPAAPMALLMGVARSP